MRASDFDRAVVAAKTAIELLDADDDIAALAREFVRQVDANRSAFNLGFEHAVAGGDDAASQMPQLRGLFPLVLFFGDAQGRDEMIAACRALKPGMVTARIPVKGGQ